MDPKGLLLATGPHSEADKSGPQRPILFL